LPLLAFLSAEVGPSSMINVVCFFRLATPLGASVYN
jgi:hypothetical protein